MLTPEEERDATHEQLRRLMLCNYIAPKLHYKGLAMSWIIESQELSRLR